MLSREEYLARLQATYVERPDLWAVEMAAAEQRGDIPATATATAPSWRRPRVQSPQPSAAPEGGDANE